MHDNDDSNERLLDVREVEEPHSLLMGSDSQQNASGRWGMLSDTGSVVDLAVAEDNEPIESQPDSAKKRWRSDTMVDRDTYLMGRKRRVEGVEKVFGDGTNEARPSDNEHDASFEGGTSSPPLILDIAAPAPAEPHIPTPDFATRSEESNQPAPQEVEELMKPPMVVPSQARFVPQHEIADPILEEPSIIPVPVLAPTPLVKVEEKAEAVDPPPEPVSLPAPSTAEAIPEASVEEEETTLSTDITASEEEEVVLISPTEVDVGEVKNLTEEPLVSASAEELPEKEEDVTEAEEEAVGEEVAAEPTPCAAGNPDVSASAVEEDSKKMAEKEDVEESAQKVVVADATEPSEPSAAGA